ncbi:MAG: long-chain fatty acid--CoA ligase [Treponema sp.]|nr:long-chain fatty acid--CoA ligase [Treponema sp.]
MTKVKEILHLSHKEKFPKNLPLLLKKRAEECPDIPLQAYKNELGKFEFLNYQLVYRRVLNLAAVLKDFGVCRGDLVGLISDNRREWLLTDFALLALGAADVPRGCDSMGTEIRFILGFTNCRLCFFENERQLNKVLEKVEDVPELKDAVLFESPCELTMERAAMAGIRVHKFIDLEDMAKRTDQEGRDKIEEEMEKTEAGDVATIIFTSGTTGTPKGVMITHDNIIAQCEVIKDVLVTAREGDIWLSVLPIWHIMERAYLYCIIALKSGIAYSKPAISIMTQDIKEINPNWIVGVPRLWDAFVQSCYRSIKKKGGFPQALFNFSMTIGLSWGWAYQRFMGLVCRYSKRARFFDHIKGFIPLILLSPPQLLCFLICFKGFKKLLGKRISGVICGGGSLQRETGSFFYSIRVPMLDCYGMTETAPFLALGNPRRLRSGCIGKVFPSAQVKVVAQKDGIPLSPLPLKPGKKGILFAKGRQVMKGYYRRPDLTQKVIDKDGWINTGDFAILSQKNEVTITGRAKDTIVLLGGENIEPQVVENAICRSKFIESAVVVGQDKKYIAALIVPYKDALENFAAENHVYHDNYESLLNASETFNLIRGEIDNLVDDKNGFRTCERVAKFVLLPESFKIGKEINGKQIVMRHKIEKIYAREIRSMFFKN